MADGCDARVGSEPGAGAPPPPGARAARIITELFVRDNPPEVVKHDPSAPMQWVCRAAERFLGVDGAGISLIVGGSYRGAVGIGDPVLELLEAAQFLLAEGPCFQAVRLGCPVSAADFRSRGSAWPVFACHIAAEPVGAFFAFPLTCAGQGLGALAMYRREPLTRAALG